jgi:hypothetical protein
MAGKSLNRSAVSMTDAKRMWQPIASAPFGREVELAVIDGDGIYALVFPCRRTLTGWMKAGTTERIDVSPTHWRLDSVMGNPLTGQA